MAEIKLVHFEIAQYEMDGKNTFSVIGLGDDGKLYKWDTHRKKALAYTMQVRKYNEHGAEVSDED